MAESFKTILNKRKQDSSKESLPVKGGRISVADGAETSLASLISDMSLINPDFYFEMLEGLDYLAMYHGEVSQAVDNIKQLGNTKYSVYFDDSVPEADVKEMQLRLKTKSKNWYAYSGGINSLITDLLGQVAISGALSSEAVPSNNLDGVAKTVLVSPKKVRFKYDLLTDSYTPHQVVTKIIGLANTVELNTNTYSYIAMSRQGEKPYAVPPFLAAMLNVDIGATMMNNVKYIVKKWGTLGFLKVLVNAPTKAANETDDQFFRRNEAYLERVRPEIEKGMSKGFVVGFKDHHDMEVTPTTSHAAGAVELFDLNDKKMMSGLKQDPLMFGRNFSTTETLGRVILAKMTTQVGNYQKIVASYLEKVFLLDLQLAGYAIQSLEVAFDPPMIGDTLRDEQVRTTQIANATRLYEQGIISQQQFAVELGYEKADQEEPRTSYTFYDDEDIPDDTSSKEDATEDTTSSNSLLIRMGAHTPEYPYAKGCSCTEHTENLTSIKKDNSKLGKFIEEYYTRTKRNYSKATKKLIGTISQELAALGEGATVEHVYDKIINVLATQWDSSFNQPQKKVINSMVNNVYNHFRKDKSIFGAAADGVPSGTFNVMDFRALEYFKNSDSYFLGKFITDKDVQNKVTKFLKDNYLTGNLPIGNNVASINAFKKEFGNILDLQDWKISQIVTTSVSKMRNTATVSYMDEAGVSEYEIKGIGDRLQCSYCQALQGKRFSVSRAVDNVSEYTNTAPEFIGVASPFLTSIYKDAGDISKLTGSQLQDSGFHLVPAHASCRDTIVVVL